jgi:hypothetical protein
LHSEGFGILSWFYENGPMVLNALNIRGFLFRCEYGKISCGERFSACDQRACWESFDEGYAVAKKTLQGDGTRLEGQVVNDISCHYALQYKL